MHRLKHVIVVFLTLLACVGCDQAMKGVAKEYLPRSDVMSFAGDTVRLQYTENKGAFLSMGASLPEKARRLIFTVGVGAIVVALLCYLLMVPPLTPTTTIALSLICGGGLGNLIDRIAYSGHVIDFLNVGFGGLRTGIFNVILLRFPPFFRTAVYVTRTYDGVGGGYREAPPYPDYKHEMR